MPPLVHVLGMRDVQAAFARAPKDARAELRSAFREVAEPIRTSAEAFAQRDITRIGTKWFKMRTGVTRRLVYVAPVKRGVKGASLKRRGKQFADLLEQRALDPAAEAHEGDTVRAAEHALDRVADHFNR